MQPVRCRKSVIFQTTNLVRSNRFNSKYQMFLPTYVAKIEESIFNQELEFVANSVFFIKKYFYLIKQNIKPKKLDIGAEIALTTKRDRLGIQNYKNFFF